VAQFAFELPSEVDSLFNHELDHLSSLVAFQTLKSSKAAVRDLEWFVCGQQVPGHVQMAAFDRLIETRLGLEVELVLGFALEELSHFFEPLVTYSVSRIILGN
jgi:hypothetical protein